MAKAQGRMVTASFLVKDLYLDWRIGARHFMEHLVDGDVASNQLNWQWVAGTGTDANPHRILNPTRQALRFDPSGAYIRHWVTELARVDAPEIHCPSHPTRARHGYPHRRPLYTDTTTWCDSRGLFAAGTIEVEGAGEEPALGITGVIKPT